jgi:uncharacterized protein (TIGR02001 family)
MKTKMKKITAILAASVAGATIASAQDLSISATVAWESDYIFRGVQLAEEFFAPSVDVSYGDFYVGMWAAMPIDAEYFNEVDFYAGYGFGINEMLSADVGITAYTYPEDGAPEDTTEGYAGLSFETELSPAIYVYYDFDLQNLTIEGSVGHSIALSEEGSVDMTAYLGWVALDENTMGFDDYYYLGAGVAYSYAFTDNASFSIGVNWAGSSEDTMGTNGSGLTFDSDNEFTFGTSFTAGF